MTTIKSSNHRLLAANIKIIGVLVVVTVVFFSANFDIEFKSTHNNRSRLARTNEKSSSSISSNDMRAPSSKEEDYSPKASESSSSYTSKDNKQTDSSRNISLSSLLFFLKAPKEAQN